ncbi:MAG: OsmC family protein [Kofleriaceae bacterium]
MSNHVATVEWTGAVTPTDFAKGRYSRVHQWTFDGGAVVPASPSPAIVPKPWSDPTGIDPEEAYVASIASCHLLTFLFVASKAGFSVAHYRDEAVGEMTKNERGVPWVSKVTLSPVIEFVGDRRPTPDELAQLHHRAHDECFIANSVSTEIVVMP